MVTIGLSRVASGVLAPRDEERFRSMSRKAWSKQSIAMLERAEREDFQKPAEVMKTLAFRPHHSNTARVPDVLQYVAAFNGIDSWQLYRGDGRTAYADVPRNEWMHVKLEVSGTQARVFLGDAAQPALVIHDLARGRSKGGLGLMGPQDGTAYFSGFGYRADDTLRLDPPPPACSTSRVTPGASDPARTASWRGPRSTPTRPKRARCASATATR